MAEALSIMKTSADPERRLLYQPSWSPEVWDKVWTDRQSKMAEHRRVFRKSLTRYMNQLESEVRNNLREQWSGSETILEHVVLFKNDDWLDCYKNRMLPVAVRTVHGGGSVGFSDVSPDDRFVVEAADHVWAEKVVKEAGGYKLASIDRAIRRALEKCVQQEEVSGEFSSEMEEMVRLQITGRDHETATVTETLKSFHYGVQKAYQRAGVRKKVWMTSLRDNVRDSHRAMHGQEVSIGDSFVSGNGSRLAYPGDPMAPPSDTANCYCVILATS
ncbi:phage minor head protein [candidate division KSB1 bacterium]